METTTVPTSLSAVARQTYEGHEGQPFLINDWDRAVFLHYRVEPEILQPSVPFELDTYKDVAYVSCVAFTMRRLRLRSGGKVIEWLTTPFNTHGFLNVRTYVKHNDETGIFFLAEWLPSALSALIGPRTYGLPFRYGRLDYHHEHEVGRLSGGVQPPFSKEKLQYDAILDDNAPFQPAEAGSLDEFLLERYAAFTKRGFTTRRFRVWHKPWPAVPIHASIEDASLLRLTGSWFDHAHFIGGHYSKGLADVWMSRPRCINGQGCATLWHFDDLAANRKRTGGVR